jgi:Uma2 family endonuclease
MTSTISPPVASSRASARPRLSLAEFELYAAQPENADRILEWIDGEIFEMPSNPFASFIASRLNRILGNFVEEHRLGFITGEAGGYQIGDHRYAPDVAFISKSRQAQLATSGYNPTPPDLAVEVEFPQTVESLNRLRIKIGNYLAVGTVVWVIIPEEKRVEVHVPGQAPQVLGVEGTLSGDPILPGFALAVQALFAEG